MAGIGCGGGRDTAWRPFWSQANVHVGYQGTGGGSVGRRDDQQYMQGQRQASTQQFGRRDQQRAQTFHLPGADPGREVEMWLCGEGSTARGCLYANFAYRNECRRCGAARLARPTLHLRQWRSGVPVDRAGPVGAYGQRPMVLRRQAAEADLQPPRLAPPPPPPPPHGKHGVDWSMHAAVAPTWSAAAPGTSTTTTATTDAGSRRRRRQR